MTKFYRLLALSLMACGPDLEINCRPGYTGPWKVKTEARCELIKKEVQLMVDIWEYRQPMGGVDPRKDFQDVSIRTDPGMCVKMQNPFEPAGHCRIGEFWGIPNRQIRLNTTRLALFHELLHAAQFGHLQLGTSWHEHWDTNGFDATVAIYESELELLWRREGYSTDDPEGVLPW
jgi:hypothetical protein